MDSNVPKLILYGGGSIYKNTRTDSHFIKLTAKKNPSITYIPSSSEYGEIEFREFCENFGKKFKIKKFIYFPVDIPFTEAMRDLALSQDAVYLSGGNTYSFLKSLRSAKLIPALRDYAHNGGVVAGLSAGGIVLTPNISTAGFPYFDRDSNFVNIRDQKSLKLTQFEFYPHYVHTSAYKKALLSHSRKTLYPIYAVPDFSGVVVQGQKTRFLGPVHVYWNGRHFHPAK